MIMTKSDLKDGMIVEVRNGNKFIIIGDRIVNDNGWMPLDEYDEDNLTNANWESDNEEWDIVKVYENQHGIYTTNINKLMRNENEIHCIYDRNANYADKLRDRLNELQRILNGLFDSLNKMEFRHD